MASPADRAAAAHQASWRQLHGLWGRGWLEGHPGFMVSFTELAVPAFNGATVYGPFAPDGLTTALLALERSGCPYSLQARPGVRAEAAAVAARLGLDPRDPVPMMLCESPPPAPVARGLRIRELSPEESGIHAAILAEAFVAPLALSVELTPAAMLQPQNVWTLVGDYDGRPVTTAFVDIFDRVAQVHNVGTREAFRGRGFGAAISAAATRVAFAAGADLVMLLSSPMGLRVYEGIGFRTAEHWSVWESPEP